MIIWLVVNRLTISRPARPGLFSPERMRVDAKNSDARGVMWPFLVLLSMIIPMFAMWRFKRRDPDGFERQRVKIIALFRHVPSFHTILNIILS
jgi:hypothetical protein